MGSYKVPRRLGGASLPSTWLVQKKAHAILVALDEGAACE